MGQVFGTQIRHACPQPSAIRGLVLPVVRAPFVALLVSALRVRHDDLARLVTAPAGAIFLAPIARPTDRQELLAAGAREEPVIEHDLERADFLPWLSFSGEAASRRRDLARQGRPGVAAPGLRPIGRVPFPRNPPPSGLRNFRRSICRPQITRIGVAGHSRDGAAGQRRLEHRTGTVCVVDIPIVQNASRPHQPPGARVRRVGSWPRGARATTATMRGPYCAPLVHEHVGPRQAATRIVLPSARTPT